MVAKWQYFLARIKQDATLELLPSQFCQYRQALEITGGNAGRCLDFDADNIGIVAF